MAGGRPGDKDLGERPVLGTDAFEVRGSGLAEESQAFGRVNLNWPVRHEVACCKWLRLEEVGNVDDVAQVRAR
jgi:hypothetical protein